MTTTIAVAGKGGTGKTTLTGLLIRCLKENKTGSILAIDADPASNLNTVLGMPLLGTVGDIREDTASLVSKGQMAPGMSKQDHFDYQINQVLVEGQGVDLLAMGRPEGPGCYCAANNMLRTIVDRLTKGYDWVVIDNEAGLEHLSRRTTRDVDVLLIVSDPSLRGITTAGRVLEVVSELKTKVGNHYLIVNRVVGELTPQLQEAITQCKLNLVGTIPMDPLVAEFDATGKAMVDLPRDSTVCTALREIERKILP